MTSAAALRADDWSRAGGWNGRGLPGFILMFNDTGKSPKKQKYPLVEGEDTVI